MIITTSVPTTYNLALPSGLITLYNCKFGDGSTSKTFTNAGTVPITLTPPSSPNVSVVAEVWSTQRIQTFIVQLTDDYYVDPYYIKNTPYYVRPQDRQDTCPILYSASTDTDTIVTGVLFSDLPVATFNALDTLEFVYDRESSKLWVLSKQYPVSVVATEDWNNDPIVALFNLRDSSDTRYFIFVHSSGTIRKLDTTYTQIATANVGSRVVDAVQYPVSSTLTDFVVLGDNGTLYKYNISLALTLTATSNFVKLLGDTYNKQSFSIIQGVTGLGDMYNISTTLIFTNKLSNILTINPRIDTGPEYFWGYSPLYSGFANILSDGSYVDAQGFPNSFPLEYSSDPTYQRISDGWSNVCVGIAKRTISFPDGANPYIRFIDTAAHINYVGRRRLNRATFSVSDGYFSPTLNLLDYSVLDHTATIRVLGVNTELGISWPPEVELTVTDYTTGLQLTTINSDCVIHVQAVNQYLDPSFFMAIGKSSIELKISGRLYIPDVPRFVGMYYGIVANPIQSDIVSVTENPSLVFIDTPQAASISVQFDSPINQTYHLDLNPDCINLPVAQVRSVTPQADFAPLLQFHQAQPETVQASVFGIDSPTPYTEVTGSTYMDLSKAGWDKAESYFIDSVSAGWDKAESYFIDSVSAGWDITLSVFETKYNITATQEPTFSVITSPVTAKHTGQQFRFWSKESMCAVAYQDQPPYTYPVQPKWFTLRGLDSSFTFGYDYKHDFWFDAECVARQFADTDPYDVPIYPSQYQYNYEFYVSVYPSQYQYNYEFYVALYPQYYSECYAGQIDKPSIGWRSLPQNTNVGMNSNWCTYTYWSKDILPKFVMRDQYSVGLDPQVLYHEYYQVELTPHTLVQQAQSIRLNPQTKVDLHSYGFEIQFNGINEDKFFVPNLPKHTVTTTLLPNLVGVPAGYFRTELDALQNAVNIWNMLAEEVFAIKLSSGYWVWSRLPDCDNLCEGAGCNMSGYITGG